MSVLDDARQLLNGMDPSVQGICRFCYATEVEPGRDEHIEHRPGCVYLRRSRIVAALEAAERLADRFYYAGKTETNALMAALVAALRGPTESPEPSPLTGTTC